MIATQTLEVLGIRRRDTATVTVELGAVQADASGDPMPMLFTTHVIDVAAADLPALGALVTVTYAIQA
ncbi:MAG TPA: hypothetical protein VF613_13080 [Longimicrobium sp.]|jgi:hypothetical protein